MIIAIDLRALTSGITSGVETYTVNLVNELMRLNPDDTHILYVNSYKELKGLFENFKGHRHVKLQTRIPNKIFNLLLAVFRYPKLDHLIKKKTGLRPDIFFAPDLRPSPLGKYAKKIITIHDLSFIHYPEFFSLKTRLWYKYIKPVKEIKEAARLIAVSKFTATDLIDTYGIAPDKITVIHEGVRGKFATTASAKEKQAVKNIYNLPEKFFLFFGTLEPRKNLPSLIKAFDGFTKKNNDFKLVICGQMNPKVFNKFTPPNNPRVIYTGFVKEHHKPIIYQLSEALIYPSYFEGFGLPIAEAIKSGTPVITSNTGSMPEIAQGSAILINPHDWKTIAKAMKNIINPAERKILIQKMAPVAKKYTWEKSARKTAELFHSISPSACNPSKKEQR